MRRTRSAESKPRGRLALPHAAQAHSLLHTQSGIVHRVSRRAAALLIATALAASALLVALTYGGRDAAQAAPGDPLLSGSQVIAALQQAGLPVDNPHEDPIAGSPSSAPATEREAWSFAIPSVAPSGGRVLVFADDNKLQQKGAWFRRAGATVAVHRNVILWLDPDLDPSVAARYRQALRDAG